MQNISSALNKIKRRGFFAASGKAIAGLLFLKLIPVKIPFKWLAAETKNKSKRTIQVTEHPLAVKFGTRKVNVNE